MASTAATTDKRLVLQCEPDISTYISPPSASEPVKLEFVRLFDSCPPPAPDVNYAFTLRDGQEIPTRNERRRVFRAALSSWNCSGTIVDVVCKVARGRFGVELLMVEADLYQGALKELQCLVVPPFIGLATGKTKEGVLVGVMVLQYSGVSLQKHRLKEYGVVVRKTILYAIIQVHERGIYHHQFEPEHILYDKASRRVILIDFAAAISHQCSYPGTMQLPVEFYERGYSKRDCDCEELIMATEKLEAWSPLTWAGRMFRAQDLESTLECLVEEASKGRSDAEWRARLEREAKRVLIDFGDWLRSRMDRDEAGVALIDDL